MLLVTSLNQFPESWPMLWKNCQNREIIVQIFARLHVGQVLRKIKERCFVKRVGHNLYARG